jgi:hypothetical protein
MRKITTTKGFLTAGWSLISLAALVAGCDDQSGTSSAQSGTSATQGISAGASSSSSITTCYSDYPDTPDVPSESRRPGGCSGGLLTIAGAPGGTVLVGSDYSFQPSASDTGGMGLSFSVQNKPSWATFDASTGTLSGVPTAADVGTYSNILISASNTLKTVTLRGFSIAVTEGGTGSVTISWMPPTTNSDGTPITNLAGYQIVYGTSASALVQTINVSSAGLTSYVVDNLAPGTWYFAIKSVNNSGVNSSESPVVSFKLTGT